MQQKKQKFREEKNGKISKMLNVTNVTGMTNVGEDMQLQDLKCIIFNLQTHFTRTDFTQFTAVSLAAN